MSGLAITQMRLDDPALAFALALREACPSTIFLSGRRENADQARAMAQDTVKDRTFIFRTYTNSIAKRALLSWLNSHPEIVDVTGLYLGFLGVLEVLTDEELSHLSHHFLGLALDIAVGSCDDLVLESLVKQYGGKLLTKEGGLIRRHVEFPAEIINQGPPQENEA